MLQPKVKLLQVFFFHTFISEREFDPNDIFLIDESLNHYFAAQQRKQMMLSMEFNRKVSNDKELEKSESNRRINIIFDCTGNFIMYATMIGIKCVNLVTNKVKTVIGKNENLRFIHLALIQNEEARNVVACFLVDLPRLVFGELPWLLLDAAATES